MAEAVRFGYRYAMKNGIPLSSWTGGCHSMLPPDDIQKNQYVWGINVVNRGGIIQTRPGYQFTGSIPGINPQGSRVFTPKDSGPVMVIAVDGLIYVSHFPFNTYTQLQGIRFRADAEFIVIQPVVKSVKLNPDGSLELISPTPMVVIQDGSTLPAVYDGITARHTDPRAPFYGPPIGLWMEWAGNRLWVGAGNKIFASDLESPDTWSENTYIAERSGFGLPGECTGLIETNDEKALLAFTADTTTALQSNIRDRAQWQLTPNFQRVIVKHLGCVAGRSPVNQYGMTWWMSKSGWVNLDAALYSQQTSKILTLDDEMMRSKRILASHLDGICSCAFENYMLVSVPSGGKHNEQTWASDQAPNANAVTSTAMAWCGIWTGMRPVEWMNVNISGRERLYCLTYDATAKDGTNIHIWEAFRQDRRDNRGGILCQWESGMVMGQDLSKFEYAEIDLIEILGNVDLKIFVGGFRGPWILVKETKLQAEIGSLGSEIQKTITKESILQAFKPQSRVIKTEDFSSQDKNCGVESRLVAGTDKGFQMLFEWRGRMGIKRVIIFTSAEESKDRGECSPSEAGAHNILTETGETIET